MLGLFYYIIDIGVPFMTINGPQEFYQHVIDYFEDHFDDEVFLSRVTDGVESGHIDQRFRLLVPEITRIRLPIQSRENHLVITSRNDFSAFLKALRGSRCMLGQPPTDGWV